MENKINFDVFTQPDEKNNLDEEYEQNLTEQEKNRIYNDYLDRKQNQTIKEGDNCFQDRKYLETQDFERKQDVDQYIKDRENGKTITIINDFNDIDPNQRCFMILDKDNNQYFDIRDENNIFKIIKNNSVFSKSFQSLEKSFWKKIQKESYKFLDLVEDGDLNRLRKILDKNLNIYPININFKTLDDYTALHFASQKNDIEIIKFLLENQADINSLTSFKRNALHITSIKGFMEASKILILYKININQQDVDLNTPLHLACEKNNLDMVQYLIQKGANVNLKNKQQKLPYQISQDQNMINYFQKNGYIKQIKKNENQESQKSKVSIQKITPLDFKYLKILGQGAFGKVYLVRYKKNGQLYAMKVLNKRTVQAKRLERYVKIEKDVQAQLNHPFITKLQFAFQNDDNLFLVLEYCPGGDLGTLLTRKRKFTEEIARIYIAEIISALEYLHRNEIIYRDLKPENIILDKNGHIKITDFGLAKKLLNDSQTRTYLGTPAYFAPEIIMKSGHNRMVDWWTVGILLYECLVGMPPFYSRQREELFENIKTAPIKIPKSMSQEAKDLIKQLLNRNPKKRLGAQNDAIDIKNHIFFKDFNWDDLLDKKFQMPEVQIDKIPESELIIQFKEKQDPLKDIKDWTIISDC